MGAYICRKCGASLIPQNDGKTAICDYCGSVVHLPSVNAEVFNRAVKLRMDKKFDQAATLFKQCVNDNPQDAESHWNLLLCKFGILYVEEENGNRLPVCNGITYNSILQDEDYLDTIRYSDELSGRIYEEEARRIATIQQEIIRLSRKEEKFDVFISYKETDENGGQTESSNIAQQIYDTLTAKGYKVFCARVSLKGQAGMKYEPIIFSALDSASVMLLVGTSAAQLESVWVSNEWQRFLYLAEKDKDKKLEVIYKDMKRADLPTELRFMPQRNITESGKYGWQQDVAYDVESMPGIQKKKKGNEQIIYAPQSNEQIMQRTIQNFYDRSNQSLRQNMKDEALKYLDQALDIDDKRAETWWRMLKIVSNEFEIGDGSQPTPEGISLEYAQNVLKFAGPDDGEYVQSVNEYLDSWKHKYGNACYHSLTKILKASDCYSNENAKNIHSIYENVKKYASEEILAQAGNDVSQYNYKQNLYQEYQQKTEKPRYTFGELRNNSAQLRNLVNSIGKITKKIYKIDNFPAIFSFSGILIIAILGLVPYLILHVWDYETQNIDLWGWIGVVNMPLFIVYIVILIKYHPSISDSDSFHDLLKSNLLIIPLIGVLYFVILFFHQLIYKLCGLFCNISIPNDFDIVHGFDSSAQDMAINRIMIKMFPVFRIFLIILVVSAGIFFIMTIISHIIKKYIIKLNQQKEEMFDKMKELAFSEYELFAKPYTQALDSKFINVNKDFNNMLSTLDDYFFLRFG